MTKALETMLVHEDNGIEMVLWGKGNDVAKCKYCDSQKNLLFFSHRPYTENLTRKPICLECLNNSVEQFVKLHE